MSAVGHTLNVIGLLFGLAGALIVFRGAPAQQADMTGVMSAELDTRLNDGGGKTVGQQRDENEARFKRQQLVSRIGVTLVVLSALVQLVAVLGFS